MLSLNIDVQSRMWENTGWADILSAIMLLIPIYTLRRF